MTKRRVARNISAHTPERPNLSLDDVTYEMFGIDPNEFYATKFAKGRIQPQFLNDRAGPAEYRFTYMVEEFNRLMPTQENVTRKVLDVGCGSGRFGAFLKHRRPDIELVGLELSEACRDLCVEHGYDDFVVTTDIQNFPFEDRTFDAVISMDLFGHIEFKNKDRTIAETARVLIDGGLAVHGVETGTVNYLGSNDPSDPEDHIRKYIWIDGHIGVETADDTVARFGKVFEVTRAIPMIFPFHLWSVMAHAGALRPGSTALFDASTSAEKERLVHIGLRAAFDYIIDNLHRGSPRPVSPRLYVRDDSGNELELRHGGFTMISMQNTR